MLYFRTKPDSVFTEIVHRALTTELEEITRISVERDHDAWDAEYASIGKLFSPYIALVTLEDLLRVNKETAVYRLTEAHWLLMYECLKNFVALHNDMAWNEPNDSRHTDSVLPTEINFDKLVTRYFWDTDHLMVEESTTRPLACGDSFSDDGPSLVDLTKDIFPHPSHLQLIPVDRPAWQVLDPQASFELASDSGEYDDDLDDEFSTRKKKER